MCQCRTKRMPSIGPRSPRDELHDILLDALSSGDTNGLIRYIEANRYHLKDRYEGGPLSDNWNWKNELENL